ncbi:hypothetical protein FQN54_000403 [Arachnomyces sp. PD_36]|nr:hypothetical protein FQN54_000403 [Arachnomyces sp. PD_36]
MAPSYTPVPSGDTDDTRKQPGNPGAHMATTTLKVDGMTCGACTSAVEGAFKDVPGAGNVSVSLVMGRAVVHHDPEILPADKVAEMIEDRGFDALVLATDGPRQTVDDDEMSSDTDDGTDEPTVSTTNLSIEGMTCGACTSAVEGGLQDADGVKSITVSLLSERAVVEHDASVISPEEIAEIIEDRGFGATVLNTTQSGSKASKRKSRASNKPKMATTTVSIEGMTCGACTSAVEGAFKNTPGLVQFRISLLAERAVLVHDPSLLAADTIVETIEDAGFDARLISSQMDATLPSQSSASVDFTIYGLSDANSADRLQDILQQKPGVISASVSIATSRATITYNTSSLGIRALVETIEGAGFNALIADTDDNNAQLQSLAKTKEIQEWQRAFWFSFSFAVPVFLISMIIPMYITPLDFGSIELFRGLFLGDLVCMALTIPVQFGIGKRFYVSAFKSLKHRSPTMDVLVVLGTSAAFFFSIFAMVVALCSPPHSRPSTIFDTSTMLLTFITLGRWLENRAKGQTSQALSRLMSLAPSMATIYDDPIAAEKAAENQNVPDLTDEKGAASSTQQSASGHKIIPTELIQMGDIIVLRPGDKVPADGTVTRGESYIDESMITGEAIPIHKKKGSIVMAGTVNGAGWVDFRVTRAGRDTQLSQIVKLVQDAQTSRAPIQRMADVVAGYFIPIIVSLGLITFFGWMILSHLLPKPPQIFTVEGNGGKLMVCLKLCISVIVFACPCALGLSTPTAVMVGTGVGAENGILVKGGAALEAATKVNHIVFDKTGTLTVGKMNVADSNIVSSWSSNESRRLWWLLVGLAEMNSEHPVAKAIVAGAKSEIGISSDDSLDGSVNDFEASVGNGVSATIEPTSSSGRARYRMLMGNATFLRSKAVEVPESADPNSKTTGDSSDDVTKPDAPAGETLIHVAIDEEYAGSISLRDTVKSTATAAVAALHRMGLSVSLVTGDTYSSALAIAKIVGIPASSIHASVKPSEKREIVENLQSAGDTVGMVGDGINDSPALATASVGIALASGTDVAIEAADIVLMRPDDLLSVPASLCLARTIFRRIKFNLLWACMYNVIGLPFAMGLFIPFNGLMLHPMAAGAAMAASSISVVMSSLLLKFWGKPRWLNVEGLEKEAEMGIIAAGGGSRKSSWWKKSPVTKGSPSSGVGFFGQARDSVAGLVARVTGNRRTGIREDEGYVPLRTIEPAV